VPIQKRGQKAGQSGHLKNSVLRAASTAKRLCNKAQGWTEGTTLGPGDAGAINPNGVVAGGKGRRLAFCPPGRNPVGVDGHRRVIAQTWRCANPYTGAGRIGHNPDSRENAQETQSRFRIGICAFCAFSRLFHSRALSSIPRTSQYIRMSNHAARRRRPFLLSIRRRLICFPSMGIPRTNRLRTTAARGGGIFPVGAAQTMLAFVQWPSS
jgi:hypothetical protein